MKEIKSVKMSISIDGNPLARLEKNTSSVTIENDNVTIFTNDELIVRLCKIISDLQYQMDELSKRRNEAVVLCQRYKDKLDELRAWIKK